MGIGRTTAQRMAPVATKAAPGIAGSYVREVLERAIDGVGPFKPAAESAEAKLTLAGGSVPDAIDDLIGAHVKMAGVQGFVTNIGGVVTLAVAIPANVTGLALLQCHLVAGIAHLRGYDLADSRVRNAILACLLGEDTVRDLLRKKKLPSSPMALATSPVHDPLLDKKIASEVTAELIAKVAGRRAAIMVGRRIPLLGGGIAAATDGLSTYQIGRYATAELRERGRISSTGERASAPSA